MAIGIREIISSLYNDNVVYGDVSKRNDLGGTKMDSWTAKVIITKAGNTITYGDTSKRRDLGGIKMNLIEPSVYEAAIKEYCKRDIETTKAMVNMRFGIKFPDIKKVIFNPPATVVYFKDGTKTVVKCQEGDEFDAEKGLAMAVAKRAYGNKGNYCDQMKKWVEEYEAKNIVCTYPSIDNEYLAAAMERFKNTATMRFTDLVDNLIKMKHETESVEKETEDESKPWRIWWIKRDQNQMPIERSVSGKYFSKEFANEKFKDFMRGHINCSAMVSDVDPWADNPIVSKLPLWDCDEAKPWRIWYRQINPKTFRPFAYGVDLQNYASFEEALKVVREKYQSNADTDYHVWISKNSPFESEGK